MVIPRALSGYDVRAENCHFFFSGKLERVDKKLRNNFAVEYHFPCTSQIYQEFTSLPFLCQLCADNC